MSPLVKKGKKLIYLEWMRIFAVFFVIFNHTGTQGFLLFTEREPGSLAFFGCLCTAIFCKFSVGLFLAISGALLLGREEEPLGQIWKKRILPTFMILLIFSIIYYLNRGYLYGEELSAAGFVAMFYSTATEGHLWYLYAHMSLMISLPFLRAIVRDLDTKYYYYMISIFLVIDCIIPILEYFVGQGAHTLNWHMTVPWIGVNIIIYPLLGYFMEHKVPIEKCKRWLLPLWGINMAGIALSAAATYGKGVQLGGITADEAQTFLGNFSVLNIICIYLTIKYVCWKFDQKKTDSRVRVMGRVVMSMGSCTFGIYLIHVLVLKSPWMKALLQKMLEMGMNDMAAVMVQCLAVFLICYGMTWGWKKIVSLMKSLR